MFPMYKSILQFCQKGAKSLENSSANFFTNPKDIAGFVESVSNEVIKLGCSFIGEVFSELDQGIRDSQIRKKNWEIVRRDRRTMICSLGEFSFDKTLYKHKKTGERKYLLDSYLELDSYSRITEDAQAKILSEAAQTSYRKAGDAVSITDNVSKGTVKNMIHNIKFPPPIYKEELKKVEYLYIEADEDHVPLQFINQKGDIEVGSNGYKLNNVQMKLVYVHEGIEKVAPESKRHRLINPHYFSGIYEGRENARLWDEVYEYIEKTYDLSCIKKIYLNADGGQWIKSGKNRISGTISVLDEYHINKYLTSMTSHLLDGKAYGRELLRDAIRKGNKSEFKEVVEIIKDYAQVESDLKRIDNSALYILSNWSATKLRLRHPKGVIGSSTEGHVSHVLASRMSSRPMGWSKNGADKMARLRAYCWNGGDILRLIRYQSELKEERMASGDEVYSSSSMFLMEKEIHKNGKYYDKIQVSPSMQVRKILSIREKLNIL